MEEGETAENNHDIVHIRNNRGYCKTPLKTHGQVNNNTCHHEAQCHQTIGNQFFTNLRADEFNLAQGNVRIVFFQQIHHLVGQLGGGYAFFVRQANHDVLVRTQCLNLYIAHFQRIEAFACFIHINALLILDFHHRTAGKFDGEIQAFGYQKEHGGDKRNQRNKSRQFAVAHKRNIAFDFK